MKVIKFIILKTISLLLIMNSKENYEISKGFMDI